MSFNEVVSSSAEEVFSMMGRPGFWTFEGQLDTGLPTETYWNSMSIVKENFELLAVATEESNVCTAKPSPSAKSIRAYFVVVSICSEEHFFLIPTTDRKTVSELCIRAAEAFTGSEAINTLQILQSQASSYRAD